MTDPALESTEPSGTGRSAYRDRTDPGVSGFLDEPLGLKVPLIGVSFWVVKVITTGMGEAMSDFLAKFSIALPVLVGVIAVAVAMVRQLRARRYHAPTYWSAVAAIAIFGTVGADGLHAVGVSTTVTSLFYAVVLGVWMVLWYRSEGTLSIHDITTRRRELFYWGTVLLTFALGTALGDWSAFFLGLGFGGSIVLYAALIVVPGVAWKFLRLNSIVAFWAAYILTRPLGASIADWLGKPSRSGSVGETGWLLWAQSLLPRFSFWSSGERVGTTPTDRSCAQVVTGEPAAVHLRWGRSRCDDTARFSLRTNEVALRIVTGSRLCGSSRAGDPLTEVFGKGQKLTAIAVKFDCVISEPPENDIVRLVVPRVITVESLS